MSEEVNTSATASEPAQPASSSPPKKDKKKLWLMIVAVIVAILLISTAVYVLVINKPGEEEIGLDLESEILPSDDLTMDALEMVEFSVTSMLVNDTEDISHEIDDWTNVTYSWSRTPYELGSFNLLARRTVEFTATNVSMSGTVTCTVEWEDESVQVSADVYVNPPYLDSVTVTPSQKTLAPDEAWEFTASAISSVGEPILGLTYTWSVTGMDAADYTLSSTTGTSVTFAGLVAGNATLNATVTYNGITKSGGASVQVGGVPKRTVDYLYYDMFNVPFGEWWEWRWAYYGEEEVVSWEYPYIFKWYGNSTNVWLYTNQRLNLTGRNMPEMNMNDGAEFLPFLGDARGGTAKIDWYMQYLTEEEMSRYPEGTAAWLDGWVVSLNGTVTLDRTAAMAVMGITSEGFDDFTTWWAANDDSFLADYTDWVLYEGNERLDIFPMYDFPLVPLSFNIDAAKVGDEIVLTYDTVSWGMEAMMTRWLKDAFMPVEWYFEDMYFRATIGPEFTDLDIDTAVVYAAYAYETTLDTTPCWMWEALMQDYVESNIQHPYSLYDVYVNLEYANYAPGSPWYGTMMPYDYAPGSHNLSENETMTLTWPSGEIPFYAHGGDYITINYTSEMTCNYSEPDWVEFPGQVLLDTGARTLTFEGPIDFWTWSKLQGELYSAGDPTRYENLGSEWDRVGVLPYGCPTIEFRMKTGADPEPTAFRVEGIDSPIEQGASASITVTVLDQYGALYPMYTGTVEFSSDDAGATLPSPYTFLTTDQGVKTFTDAVAFSAAGTFYVGVEDSANSSIYGEQVSIEVYSSFVPVPTSLRVEGVTSPIMEGVASGFTVTVLDQVGNPYDAVAGGGDYTGTITFSSNDSAAELPGDYTFTAGDAGTHTWTSGEGVVFHTPGIHDLTAVDTSDATISGSQLDISVLGLHFVVTYDPLVVIANETDVTLTVMVMDQNDVVFTGYLGTVGFTSTDDLATLPSPVTFTGPDNGVVTVPGFMFGMPGTQTVTVTDQADSTITGSLDITVGGAAEATYLVLTDVSETCMNGAPETVTVTVMDQYDRVFAAYDGTVHFSSTDASATLPGDYPFVPATDNGAHTFTDGVTFNTDGTFELRCEDAADSTLFGTFEVFVTSVAQEIASFTVEGIASGEWTGNVSSVTVTALDQWDNLFDAYAGTIHFTTDATGTYQLPSNYTFQLSDAGAVTLPGVHFDEPGTFSVTVADTVVTTATGSQTGIVVLERPVATSLVVSGYPTEASAGSAISLTVTVYDQWDEVFVWYDGTVTFSSSDGLAVLPGDYTFTALDDGVHVFDTIVLNTVGSQTVTVTDSSDSSLTDTTDPITVTEPREVQFTVYDMFAEPWGAFWDDPDWGRYSYYGDSVMLTRGTYNTMVYLPGFSISAPPPKIYQGIIMAPYRLAVDGSNMPELSISDPVFMPTLGTGTGAGGQVQMDVYMQYLDETWWADYWVATWGGDPDFDAAYFPNSASDGYELGTIYSVTLNREAAELWLGLPVAGDVSTWWSANHDTYVSGWQDWVDYEGNERLDIFNAFDYQYVDLGTFADLTEDVSGDVVLTIGHLSWGWEALVCRWLDDEAILSHEPWYEDLSLSVTYGETKSDMAMDAVCQFSMHAVKANGTVDEGAWVWESVRMDYIESSLQHPYSEFDAYADLSYQSWNAGDECFSKAVPYDTTPGIFELDAGESLVFELPTATDVLGFQGVGVPSGSYTRLVGGDTSDFDDISIAGEMDLGYYVTNPSAPVNLASMYDSGTKTLTIPGPQAFDQVKWPSGALYHGAPWIEFNVVPAKALASEPAAAEDAMVASATSAAVVGGTSAAAGSLYAVAAVAAVMLCVAALGCNVRRIPS